MAKAPKKAKAVTELESSSSHDLASELLDGVIDEIGDEDGTQLLGSDGLSMKIRGVVSTQNAEIDWATGRGGVPLGRLTILHGAEASGKTTLALHLVAEVQHVGGVAVYIDLEYKLDPEYAAAIGVDTKHLIISQPPYLEKVFGVIDAVVKRAAAIRQNRKQRVPILVIVDSMNAAITKAMYTQEGYETIEVAGPPRVWSAKLPKLMPLVSREDVALVFVSQVRKKIGVMFGDDEEIAGGNAPKFFASMILHVRRLAAEREGEVKVGNKVRVEPKKNQIAPPFKRADTVIRFGKGFDREHSLVTRGEKMGIIAKTKAKKDEGEGGNTYTFKGKKLAVGINRTVKLLRKNSDLRDSISKTIRAAEGW